MEFAKNIVSCVYHFHSNIDYPLLFGEDYVLKVDVGWTDVSIYLNLKKNSKRVIVCGPSAIDSSKVSAPFYHRWSWAKRLDCSVIIISDPTLETGRFNIGWFLGRKGEYALTKCSNIVNKIINQLNVDKKNVVFYGSSSGGFSSLMMASYFKGSKVIVQNPQIDIRKYHGNFYSNLVDSNFDGFEPDEERLNVISLFDKVKHIPDVYYIQNIFDSHHYDTHLPIFLSGLKDLRVKFESDCKIYFELYSDKEAGHDADKYETAMARLNNAFSCFYNDELCSIENISSL